MTSRRKSTLSFSGLFDSFSNSVYKTGSSTSTLTAIIFIAGGSLSTYVGYTGGASFNLAGGIIAIIIGIMIFAKAGAQKQKKKRQRQQSRSHNKFMRSSDQV